jgi:hypothetical protein
MVSAYDGCFRQNRHNEQRPLPIGRRGLGEQIAFDWKSASQLTSLAGTTASPSRHPAGSTTAACEAPGGPARHSRDATPPSRRTNAAKPDS